MVSVRIWTAPELVKDFILLTYSRRVPKHCIKHTVMLLFALAEALDPAFSGVSDFVEHLRICSSG